jgi:F-type H+-transporting ATPase subunit delta
VAARGSGPGGLAERYAAALFELADEKKELDRVAGDLQALKAMIADSADLRRLLRSPALSRQEQSRAIAVILAKMGAGEIARRFAGLVTQNRRLFALGAMIDAFLAELARRRGEQSAEVVSAVALDDRQRQAVTEALRRAVGGKVAVDLKVDPRLIGGLVVKLGSRLVDSSLKSKLQRLQLAMKGAE